MEWTTEKLVEALKESAEWKSTVDFLCTSRGYQEDRAARDLERWIPVTPGEMWSDAFAPMLSSLRVIVSDIRSGAIYGSAERCAVCGASSPMSCTDHYACCGGDCEEAWNEAHSDGRETWLGDLPRLATAILHARRLLEERKGKVPYIEQAPAAKPQTPRERLETKCNASGACPTCSRDSWYAKTRELAAGVWVAVHECSFCGCTVLADSWQIVKHGRTCETCKADCGPGKTVGIHAEEKACKDWTDATPPPAKVDPYAAQREREMTPEFGHWGITQVGMATGVFGEEWNSGETAEEFHRRRVLLGLERGPDPRLLLMGDVFDPRGKR